MAGIAKEAISRDDMLRLIAHLRYRMDDMEKRQRVMEKQHVVLRDKMEDTAKENVVLREKLDFHIQRGELMGILNCLQKKQNMLEKNQIALEEKMKVAEQQQRMDEEKMKVAEQEQLMGITDYIPDYIPITNLKYLRDTMKRLLNEKSMLEKRSSDFCSYADHRLRLIQQYKFDYENLTGKNVDISDIHYTRINRLKTDDIIDKALPVELPGYVERSPVLVCYVCHEIFLNVEYRRFQNHFTCCDVLPDDVVPLSTDTV